MGDFPPQWKWIRDLTEGGQGHTFVVRRSDQSDSREFVLKRLKNSNRDDYFEREIQAFVSLDHPNVLKLVDHGRTPKGKPFLITEYCAGGSLERGPRFERPGEGLRFFQQIADGIAHAHEQEHTICHLDLKPANILLKNQVPMIGDFGICFIEGDQVVLTSDGPRGSIYYCAPELRGPKIKGTQPLKAADVYSLGKVLYWLFTGEVHDGHEEDYTNDTSRRLVRLFPREPQFAFVDELISRTVRRTSTDRFPSAADLARRVRELVERIDSGGHPLDLRIPQRCLYCAEGQYSPVHENPAASRGRAGLMFPDIEKRRHPYDPTKISQTDIYGNLNDVARPIIGSLNTGGAIPILLVCNYCGNIQYFRWDLTSDKRGENWLP